LSGFDIKEYIKGLHAKCDLIIDASLVEPNLSMVASSHQFAHELDGWYSTLIQRKEAELLRVAALEYEYALLALVQGHYRHSFKGLRLVLELALQSVCLSSNELVLREWLDNRFDTSWRAIVHTDSGVFSVRFADAFFPDLKNHVKNYQSLSQSLYRECSECVHGNTPKHIPLPSSLVFNQSVFELWHQKADNVALTVHFALTMRYLVDLTTYGEISKIEAFLCDRLGHIEEIRRLLGGPTKG